MCVQVLDADESKGLNSKEFRMGLRKLVSLYKCKWQGVKILTKSQQDFNPPIHISDEDFAVITNNGDLLDQDGQVTISFCSVKGTWFCLIRP